MAEQHPTLVNFVQRLQLPIVRTPLLRRRVMIHTQLALISRTGTGIVDVNSTEMTFSISPTTVCTSTSLTCREYRRKDQLWSGYTRVWYQVPSSYAVDRTFLENGTVALFVSVLELWLVEGLGEVGDIEDTIIDAHFSSHAYRYGDDAEVSETSERLRYRFQWMITMQSGPILPWDNFLVARVSQKVGSILGITSAHAFFKSGVRFANSQFPYVPNFIRTASIPTGLAFPPLMSLHLYGHFVGRRHDHMNPTATKSIGRHRNDMKATISRPFHRRLSVWMKR